MKIIISFLVLIALCISLNAQTTYYVDFETGNDSNDGLTTGAPWKLHPYMKGFSGTYIHQAGDSYIFKGGIVWPFVCFPLEIVGSGTSANWDTYTIDSTWHTGASWSKPIFDLEYQEPTVNNAPNVPVILHGINYVRLTGFEIKRQGIISQYASGGDPAISGYGKGAIRSWYADNIHISHCHIHDWKVLTTSGEKTAMDHNFGGIFIEADTFIIEHCEIHGSVVSTVNGDDRYSGVGIRVLGTGNNRITRYNKIYDVPNGFLGGGVLHDNEVYDIYYAFDTNTHANGVYLFGSSDFFNNTVSDLRPGIQPVFASPWTSLNSRILVYNNKISAFVSINGDFVPAGNTSFVGVFNNIIENQGNIGIVAANKGVNAINTVSIKNNILISRGTWAAPIALDHPINNLYIDNNLYYVPNTNRQTNGETLISELHSTTYSLSSARQAGYDLHSEILTQPIDVGWFPTNSLDPGVDKGENLGFYFNTDKAGTARPQGAAWDIGAYEFDLGQTPVEEIREDIYILYDIFPNPMINESIIPLDVFETAYFKLDVMNIHGQQIKNIQNGELTPGKYNFVWDGKNGNGSLVAKGTYLVTITIGNVRKLGKIVMFK